MAFDNMQNRGVTGTTEWTRYTIELTVDAKLKNINLGLLLPGDGTAWFDDLTIELDGEPFTDAVHVGPRLRVGDGTIGFYTGR